MDENKMNEKEIMTIDEAGTTIEDAKMQTDEREEEIEALCRWGAARAGVIVVAPVVGTIALMANEVYMIKRIASVYGCKFNESNGCAFIGAMGGAIAGQTLATLIPFAPMQIGVGIAVTYAVGKAAAAWIKDGMPDMDDYKEKYLAVFEAAKEDVKGLVPILKKSEMKDKALGDESKKFDVK